MPIQSYGQDMTDRSNRLSQILNGLQRGYNRPQFRDPDVEAQVPDPEGLMVRNAQSQVAESGANYVPSRMDMADSVRQSVNSDRARTMLEGLTKARVALSPEAEQLGNEEQADKMALAEAGPRISGQTQRDVAAMQGDTSRAVAETQGRTQRDVTGMMYGDQNRTAPGLPPRSSTRMSAPPSGALTAIAKSAASVRAGATSDVDQGGVKGALSWMGIGGKPGLLTNVDPQALQNHLGLVQSAMRAQQIPDDTQEVAMELIQRYPGMSPEEKIQKLGELGYPVDPGLIQELSQALRLTGGL